MQVIEIDNKWLLEVAPHFYKEKEIEDKTGKKMPRSAGLARENVCWPSAILHCESGANSYNDVAMAKCQQF